MPRNICAGPFPPLRAVWHPPQSCASCHGLLLWKGFRKAVRLDFEREASTFSHAFPIPGPAVYRAGNKEAVPGTRDGGARWGHYTVPYSAEEAPLDICLPGRMCGNSGQIARGSRNSEAWHAPKFPQRKNAIQIQRLHDPKDSPPRAQEAVKPSGGWECQTRLAIRTPDGNPRGPVAMGPL